ncbi:MAG: hypothetical protein R6U19_06375 [Bacteroidales bacterium]
MIPFGQAHNCDSIIKQGNMLMIGDFGYFRLSISGSYYELEEDVSVSSIKKTRITCPGKYIKNVLKTIDYVKS